MSGYQEQGEREILVRIEQTIWLLTLNKQQLFLTGDFKGCIPRLHFPQWIFRLTPINSGVLKDSFQIWELRTENREATKYKSFCPFYQPRVKSFCLLLDEMQICFLAESQKVWTTERSCRVPITYLFLLVLSHIQEEERPGGQNDSVRLGAGGSRGHHSPVLVPGVPGLRGPVSFTVQGQRLIFWHNLRLGMFCDVRRPLVLTWNVIFKFK